MTRATCPDCGRLRASRAEREDLDGGDILPDGPRCWRVMRNKRDTNSAAHVACLECVGERRGATIARQAAAWLAAHAPATPSADTPTDSPGD